MVSPDFSISLYEYSYNHTMNKPLSAHPDSARTEFVDNYLAYLLARASHLISSEFHRQVEASGLTVPEWRVLASLAGGGERTIGELADIVLSKQPTVTKLIARMHDQGWVMRSAGITDRRQALVALSPAGRKRVQPLLRKARNHEARVLASWGESDSQRLKEILQTLIHLHVAT
jgi:DNA-binding MarR family transcriptional regulator